MSTLDICAAILATGLVVALLLPYGMRKKMTGHSLDWLLKYDELRKKYDAIDASVSTVATFGGFSGMNAVFHFRNKHPDKHVTVKIARVKIKSERGATFTPCPQEMATAKAMRGGQPAPIRCPVPPMDGGWVTGFEGAICFEGEMPKPYNVDFDC